MTKELNLEEIKCKYPEVFGGIELVYRSKIPGGWLIFVKGKEATPITFVPDPIHEWDGNSIK